MSASSLQDSGSQIVIVTSVGSLSRDEANRAFSAVQHPANWKLPIDAVLSTREVGELGGIWAVREAVVFFAGCLCAVEVRPNDTVRFTAVGYYAAVGA